ncbi:hypothetical protein BH23ACT9_BH23ACT9_06170 [soil metagenome]
MDLAPTAVALLGGLVLDLGGAARSATPAGGDAILYAMTVAEQVELALMALPNAETRSVGVSLTLPRPIVEALRALDAAGIVPSASAAAGIAIEQWLRQMLIRLTLDELYAEQPDLRPTRADVAAMAEDMGLTR